MFLQTLVQLNILILATPALAGWTLMPLAQPGAVRAACVVWQGRTAGSGRAQSRSRRRQSRTRQAALRAPRPSPRFAVPVPARSADQTVPSVFRRPDGGPGLVQPLSPCHPRALELPFASRPPILREDYQKYACRGELCVRPLTLSFEPARLRGGAILCERQYNYYGISEKTVRRQRARRGEVPQAGGPDQCARSRK